MLPPQKNTLSLSPFSILIIFLVCCLVGVALIPKLSVQLFPSEGSGSVSISCSMPGSSPQITEAELTQPLEGALTRLKGIKNLSSTTGAGAATINVELDKWTDVDIFRFNVSVLLRQLYPKLPQGASYPQISINRSQQGAGSGGAILAYTLNGPGTTNQIALTAEQLIRPIIASIKGVYSLEITGAAPQQLVIAEKDEVMKSISLSHQELGDVLSSALIDRDLGLITAKDGNFNLAATSNISNKEMLANYLVANKNGRVFTLADVASIKQESVVPTSFYRINGDNLVSLSIYAENKVNTIKLAQEITRAIELASKNLPKGYELKLGYNSTDRLKEELGKIYLRTFLSIGVLLAFVLLITRQARYMLIIVASLLVNVLVSFIFYYLFKLEIHLYSLAGIMISLGLVIDNVIVIVEDLRHTGRNRIFMAILASTLISLGALSVIFFLNESQKINLIDFAFAIIINLLVSLPVAYFFIPAILQKLPIEAKKQRFFRKRKQLLVKFNKLYRQQLAFMVKFRVYFLILFALAFGIPSFLLPNQLTSNGFGNSIYNKTIGSDFYQQNLREIINKYIGGMLYLYVKGAQQSTYVEDSEQNQTQLNVNISMPKGATLLQMDEVVVSFERFLKKLGNKLEVFTSNVSSPTQAYINIRFKKEYEIGFPRRLKQQLETMAIYSGAADFGIYGIGRGFNNAIDLDQFDSSLSLTGYNYNQLQSLAFRVSDTLKLNPRVKNIVISTTSAWEQKSYYEYVTQLSNPTQLSLNKVSRRELGSALQQGQSNQMMLGNVAPKNGEPMPVMLMSHYKEVPKLWTTNNAPLKLNDSAYMKLANISESKKVRVGESIVRNNQSYQLNVHYQFIGSSELNGIVKTGVTNSIQSVLPFGYRISSNDSTYWYNENNSYPWFILLVLFIIFIISAILLESLKQAIFIVLTIPFSFIGVFICFYLLGLKFDQGGYAALLMLAGLVTNASLYIINDLNFLSNNQQAKGVSIKIFIRAFNAKAMPIMVTTASAILSLLPFMISGEEKGFWFTLSAGTIGGLVFSVMSVYLLLPLCLISKKHLASLV